MRGVHRFYGADPDWSPASAIEIESRLLKRRRAVPGALDSEETLVAVLHAVMHSEINAGKTNVLNHLVLPELQPLEDSPQVSNRYQCFDTS